MSSHPPSNLDSTPTPSSLQSSKSETPLPTISVSDLNLEVQVEIEIQAQPNRDAALQERPPHTANTIPNTSTESLTMSPLVQDQETTTPRPRTTTTGTRITTKTSTGTTTTNAIISRVLEIQFSITIDLITRTGERTRREREITLRTPYHPPDLDAQATEAHIRMLYAEDADIEERVSIAVSRANARIRNGAGSAENDAENDAETHAEAYAGAYAMSTETGSESNARDEDEDEDENDDETNALAIAESNARAATRRLAAARTTGRGRRWWRIGMRELSTGLDRGREREMAFRPRGRGRGWGGQGGPAA